MWWLREQAKVVVKVLPVLDEDERQMSTDARRFDGREAKADLLFEVIRLAESHRSSD